jgi:hypothetical protein
MPSILSELELLRIKVAHLTFHLAQMQAQTLLETRERLMRETVGRYVAAEEVEYYQVDLDTGVVQRRADAPPLQEENPRGQRRELDYAVSADGHELPERV